MIIDEFKDRGLGAIKLTEIQLSNRAFIDTYDGQRIPIRDNWK